MATSEAAVADKPRTFPGDPNPPPVSSVETSTAPSPAAAAGAAAAGVVKNPDTGAISLSTPPVPDPDAPGFRVIDNETTGGREVYMSTADDPSVRMGAVNVPDADEILKRVGQYDEATKTWIVHDEAAVKSLTSGRLGYPEFLIAKFKSGEAGAVRSLLGRKILAGEMTREDAVARGHEELLKVQLGEQPSIAWSGGFGKMVAEMLKHPGDVARFATGEAAAQLPNLLGAVGAAAKGAATGAGAGLAAGAATGTLPTPAAIPVVTGLMRVGAAYGGWKYFVDANAGETAINMAEKGFEEKQIRDLAPIAGVINGTLDAVGFSVMTAPAKRLFIKNVLSSAPVKSALAQGLVQYTESIGAEISTELAQRRVDQILNNFAAQIEDKPELLTSPATARDELWDTFVRTLGATAVLGAPGAAVTTLQARADTQAEVKAAGEMTERLKTRAGTEEGAVAQVAQIAPETPAPTTLVSPPEVVSVSRMPSRYQTSADSMAGHPAFVKASEEATKAGVDPTDFKAVVDLYDTVNSRVHALRMKYGLGPGLKPTEAFKALSEPEMETVANEIADTAMKRIHTEPLAYLLVTGEDYLFIASKNLGVAPEAVKTWETARAETAAAPGGKSPAEQLEELTGLREEGKLSEDQLSAAVDKLMMGEEQKIPGEKRPAPVSFEAKTRQVEARARVQALVSDLADVRALIKEKEQSRDRFMRNNMSTRLLDKQLAQLLDQENEIKSDITFYEAAGTEAAVTAQETLAMKPATLENIVELGRKEGRKEVIKVRAQAIKDVADRLELTQADLRLLLKNKNFGLMGDVEFRHFIEGFEGEGKERVPGFKEKAAALAKRKIARLEVRKTLRDREIENEKNIRALHGLPSLGQMTTQQLFDYADILSQYEVGAVAITPKRAKALETSELAGAKTEQDIIRQAAEVTKVTPEEIISTQRGQFDPLRGDTELAESQPAYAFMVDQVQTARAKSAAQFQKFERENFRLGAAALASRKGLGRRLVPSMPEVMAHLEADPGKVYTGELTLPDITPAEQEYVDFLRSFFTMARNYLTSTGELESTRFKDIYAPHLRRPAIEVLSQIRSVKALRAAVGEIAEGWMSAQKEIGGVEVAGPVALRKFFKQTLFRTGELTPSTNVIRSSNAYAKQFFEKQGLDEAVPVVDSLFRAVERLREDKTEDGEAAMRAVRAMVADYLNNKKGVQTEFTKLAPRGGMVDLAVRMLSSWVTLKSIAFNIPLQLTAPVGETMATVPLLGARGLAKANARIFSAQGRAIAKKYESFTGKGALDEIMEPGKNIDERLLTSLFAILQWNRARTLKTVLLGMMTDQEFAAGEISDKRLAEIKVVAGRWLDIPGMKSVVGATSMGAGYTKFRGWLVPILRTTASDLAALAEQTRGGKKMTPQQIADLYRIAETAIFGTAVLSAMGKVDEDDDSFVGQLRRKIAQEVFTLINGWDPATMAKWIAGGPIPQHVIQVGAGISALVKLDEYKAGEKKGRLKAPAALAKTLPFAAALRQFQKPKRKE
jgi:hypothetical protein